MASGTLLYVVFFEILQEHRSGFNQYLSILFGFILMFGLQLLSKYKIYFQIKISNKYLKIFIRYTFININVILYFLI